MSKILHIHPNLNSAKKFVIPLMEWEKENGYFTTLIYSVGPNDEHYQKFVYDFNGRYLFDWLKGLLSLYLYISKLRPDVVFCHNTKASFFPLIFCYILGIKYRIYFNHGIPFLGYKYLVRFLLKFVELSNLFFCNRALTVSEQSKAILNGLQSYRYVDIICNGSACGIDLERIKTLHCAGSKNWRKINSYGTDELLIAFIGRAEVRKGFKKVIEIWHKLMSYDQIRLILCGPSLVDVKKFSDSDIHNISILGYVDEIFEILNEVDVVILPSFHEGLPYVVIEAMAFGCIVVGNSTVGINALIRDGHNGYLIDANDTQLFFDKIIEIYNRRAELDFLRNNARSDIRKFDRNQFMESYAAFVRNLI